VDLPDPDSPVKNTHTPPQGEGAPGAWPPSIASLCAQPAFAAYRASSAARCGPFAGCGSGHTPTTQRASPSAAARPSAASSRWRSWCARSASPQSITRSSTACSPARRAMRSRAGASGTARKLKHTARAAARGQRGADRADRQAMAQKQFARRFADAVERPTDRGRGVAAAALRDLEHGQRDALAVVQREPGAELRGASAHRQGQRRRAVRGSVQRESAQRRERAVEQQFQRREVGRIERVRGQRSGLLFQRTGVAGSG
jgi:hypothetical protein